MLEPFDYRNATDEEIERRNREVNDKLKIVILNIAAIFAFLIVIIATM